MQQQLISMENNHTNNTAAQNDQTKNCLINLLRYAISDELSCSLPPNIDFSKLYLLAKKHRLTHIVAHGLEKLNLPASEISAKFHTSKMQAIYHYARIDYEYEQIFRILEAAQICFIPLKGAIVRSYYPEPWMRNSCDIDILVKEESLAAAEMALQAKGWYRKGKKTFHDISLYSSSGVHLELHFSIVAQLKNIDTILQRCWEYAVPVEGYKYAYQFTHEFFMYHHLAHMSYHFIYGGCGIRAFLDLWILKNQFDWDDRMLRHLCDEAGLDRFYKSCMALVEVWFHNGSPSTLTAQMEQYIIEGGLYGKTSNRVLLDQAMAGGRWKNIIKRIFFSYQRMKIKYPILAKHKWMTPFFYVVRWCQLATPWRWKRMIRELSTYRNNSKKDIMDAKNLLYYLEIDQIR